MAKIELNLTKNTNEAIEGTYGKYYARVEYKGTIGVKELAQHMAEHHSGFSKGQIAGMLTDLVRTHCQVSLASRQRTSFGSMESTVRENIVITTIFSYMVFETIIAFTLRPRRPSRGHYY